MIACQVLLMHYLCCKQSFLGVTKAGILDLIVGNKTPEQKCEDIYHLLMNTGYEAPSRTSTSYIFKEPEVDVFYLFLSN